MWAQIGFLESRRLEGGRIYPAAKAGYHDSECWTGVWLMLPSGECQEALFRQNRQPWYFHRTEDAADQPHGVVELNIQSVDTGRGQSGPRPEHSIRPPSSTRQGHWS